MYVESTYTCTCRLSYNCYSCLHPYVTLTTLDLQAKPGEDLSYGDVGYHAFGNLGRVFVEWAIILSQTGNSYLRRSVEGF